jgi:MFS family permease
VLVFDRTSSAWAITALFLGMRFVPAIVAPPLVARLERPGPRVALPALYVGEAVAFLALAALTDHFALAAVIAIAMVDGALALVGRALTRATAQAILEPRGQLRAGNAVLNVGFTAGAAIGPAVAGLVVAGLGIRAALLLDAFSFVAIAAAVATTRSLPRAAAGIEPWRQRLRDGLGYLSRARLVRRLIAAQAAAFVFFAAVIPIEVIYAKATLDAGDSGYGALLASWGTGMVVGSLLFARVRRAPLPALLLASTLAVGTAYLGLAVAPTLVVACAASIVGGAGNGVQWVSVMSAVQEMTADAYQARVVGLLESVGAAMPGVGYLAGGAVAVLADPRAVFLFAGVGVVAVTLAAVPLLDVPARLWHQRAPAAASVPGRATVAAQPPVPLDASGSDVLESVVREG